MRRFFTPILILSATVYSCIYAPDKENFIEINQNVDPPEIYNQTLDLNSDTIQVWKYTRFNFDLRSSNQEITGTTVKYGNQELNFVSGVGSFELGPSTFPEGTYSLEIKVHTRSGTGSLADKLGAEGYEFKKDWVLVVQKPTIPEIKITSGIENGYLKFTWNKIDKPYFKSYRISAYDHGISNTYSREFSDKNHTSFVDSTFVGGKINFDLWVYYYNEDGNLTWQIKNFEYDFPITVTLKEDTDSLRFSWNKNPFHCTKYLQYKNGSYEFEIKSDSTCALAAPGIGNTVKYNLYFKPVNKSSWSNVAFNNYISYTLGENDQIAHKNVVYNPSLNAYYFKDEMHIKSADGKIELTGSYDYSWDYSDNSTLDYSTDNRWLYSTFEGNFRKISIDGMQLNNSKKIPFSQDGFKPRTVKILNDSICLIGYELLMGSQFALYNYNSNTEITRSEQMPSDFIALANYLYTISTDGHYAAFSNLKGLYVYEITKNFGLVLRYHDSGKYYGCFFDPKYPERLILNCPNDFKIFDCFSQAFVKTIDRFYANPINIDPATHNMLLVSFSKQKIYVYDYENDVLKFEMNHHGMPYDFKLLNNIIFVNSGYHFDISSYVQ